MLAKRFYENSRVFKICLAKVKDENVDMMGRVSCSIKHVLWETQPGHCILLIQS